MSLRRRPRLEVIVGIALLFPAAAVLRASEPEPGVGAPTSAPPSVIPEPAAELPQFKPGLWEYRRTVVSGQSAKPQISTVRKCSDPGADIRDKMAALKKKSCQFTPLRKRENHYLSSWTCPTPSGPMRFRDVLIVNDPASYEDTSEMHSAHHVTQQKIEARRLGECPGGPGNPLLRSPTPKASPLQHGGTTG